MGRRVHPNRPLTDAERALVAEHFGMALAWAMRFARRRFLRRDVGDLESAALMGLMQAAISFDPARNATFLTHARNRMNGAMLDELRSQELTGYRRCDEGPPVIERATARLPSTHESPVGWELESQEWVEWMTACLTPHERHVIRSYYLRAGVGLAVAGAELGLCESRVSQMRSAGLAYLAEMGKGR